MKKFSQFIFENLLLFVAGGLFALWFLAFLAPIFAHFGLGSAARIIYVMFLPLCHQMHWRSMHLFDYQFAWCTRDTFIYIPMIVAAVLAHFKNIKPLKWYWMILLGIPMMVDGGAQFVGTISSVWNEAAAFYESTNFTRMVTGSLFGAGVGFWIFPMLREAIDEEIETPIKTDKKQIKTDVKQESVWKYLLIAEVFVFVLFLVLVQAWDLTSRYYEPYGILDFENRSDEAEYAEGMQRCGHCVGN